MQSPFLLVSKYIPSGNHSLSRLNVLPTCINQAGNTRPSRHSNVAMHFHPMAESGSQRTPRPTLRIPMLNPMKRVTSNSKTKTRIEVQCRLRATLAQSYGAAMPYPGHRVFFGHWSVLKKLLPSFDEETVQNKRTKHC